MASPANDSYSVTSGLGIYGGRYNRSVWRRAMAAQTWAEVGANTPSEIDPEDNPAFNPNHPSPASYHGSLGQQGMITAWCGGCYDTDTDTLWLFQGGGHGDYAGNESYKIDLSVDNPSWVMVKPPSTDLSGDGSNGLYGDGRPRSTHTYNKPVYIPGVGPALGTLGLTYPNLLGVNNPFVFSPATGDVTRVGPNNPYESASSLDAAGACYDPSRNCIWIQGTARNDMTRWNMNNDTFDRFVNTGSGRSGYVSLEYMPDHDCLIMMHSNAPYGMRVFDCATGTMYSPPITGSFPSGVTVASMSGAQVRYAQSGQFVAVWNNDTNTTAITIFNAPANPRTGTWTVGQLPVSGGNAITPTARTTWGTFGRFFYSKKLDGFGVVNGVTQKLYFYART